ncbi:type II toxin-antitoxin system RelE/ParE family toxin [Agromyces sp. NPDC058484]|uniref:type II toxin-antitoxin system RelE/ParE family toxin n=1 Tax=Agromyces sp. NPDC058484 TaxID=3346524 RepID=UPI00365155C4
MSRYRVVFRREALEHLEELYDFIADAGAPDNAAGFTESIVSFCEGLADFPHRGTARMTSALDCGRSASASAL